LLPEVLLTAEEDNGLETVCCFCGGEDEGNDGEVAAVVRGRGLGLTLFKAGLNLEGDEIGFKFDEEDVA